MFQALIEENDERQNLIKRSCAALAQLLYD